MKTKHGKIFYYRGYITISTESVKEQSRKWLTKTKPKSDFIVSPADTKEHRKVDFPQG